MRDVRERLLDIRDAIERVERYARRGREIFFTDELIQTWIVHYMQILGEAASKLGNDFHDAHPEVPWERIVAMRNILVHEYFGVDLYEVWSAVEKDLPGFKHDIEKILNDLNKNQP